MQGNTSSLIKSSIWPQLALITVEKFILNYNIVDLPMVQNLVAEHSLLSLFFAAEQKYTDDTVMESTTLPNFNKQVNSVIAVTLQ